MLVGAYILVLSHIAKPYIFYSCVKDCQGDSPLNCLMKLYYLCGEFDHCSHCIPVVHLGTADDLSDVGFFSLHLRLVSDYHQRSDTTAFFPLFRAVSHLDFGYL